MNLKGKNLEEWFVTLKPNQFPKKLDLVTRYKYIKDHLKNYIHKDLMVSYLLKQYKDKGKINEFLTKHSSEHFENVINKTTDLIKSKNCKLSNYEVYILLCAIQAHDIGNIVGRENHEITMYEVFNDAFTNDKYLDRVENNCFLRIASAHSGNTNDDKDTIRARIPHKMAHLDVPIRGRFLAAVLRIADELTDDPFRSIPYLIDNELNPQKSELYHIYTQSLTSTNIEIKSKEINLTYSFDYKAASKKFYKGRNKSYLLDEIFSRNIKTHLEKEYCLKYLRPQIEIENINVDILIFNEKYKKIIDKISFRLIEQGYPSDHNIEIFDICEDYKQQLTTPRGEKWSGKILRKHLMEIMKK